MTLAAMAEVSLFRSLPTHNISNVSQVLQRALGHTVGRGPLVSRCCQVGSGPERRLASELPAELSPQRMGRSASPAEYLTNGRDSVKHTRAAAPSGR